jgi:hypothetical protein
LGGEFDTGKGTSSGWNLRLPEVAVIMKRDGGEERKKEEERGRLNRGWHPIVIQERQKE